LATTTSRGATRNSTSASSKRPADRTRGSHPTARRRRPGGSTRCAGPSCAASTRKRGLRLNKSPGRVLYAKTRLEHDVLDLLIRHFHRRFPTYGIAIQAGKTTAWMGKEGVLRRGWITVEEAVGILESAAADDQTMDADELWRQYYPSQRIPERDNPDIQAKMMPLGYRDDGAGETRAARRSRSLPDFT